MKYSFLTVLIFLVFLKTGRSQDLIVTGKGDSLNCKITQIKSDYIYFTFKHGSEIRNTLLPVGQIKSYKKNFFSKPEVPINKIENYDGNHQKLRIGIYGGWSYRTAKVSNSVPAAFQQYVKDLKSGYHIGGDVTLFISENIGFGVRYSMFRAGNELDNIYVIDSVTGQIRTGKMKDAITIQYFGPTFCTRFSSANKKTSLVSDFSLGYLSYKDNATVVDNYTLTSSTLGMLWNLGVDFSVSKDFSLGLLLSYTIGTLNHYNYDDGKQSRIIKLDKDNFEGISRIDLSVGLRWNK